MQNLLEGEIAARMNPTTASWWEELPVFVKV